MESNDEDQTETNDNDENGQENYVEQDEQHDEEGYIEDHDKEGHDEDQKEEKEHDEDHEETLESKVTEQRSETVTGKEISTPSQSNESDINLQQQDVDKKKIKEDMPELGDEDEESTVIEETEQNQTEGGKELVEQMDGRITEDKHNMNKTAMISHNENETQPEQHDVQIKQSRYSKQSMRSKGSYQSTSSKKSEGVKYLYDMAPRFQDEIVISRPSGDFKIAEIDSTVYEYYFMGEGEDEELPSIAEEEEEVEEGIDRIPYYKKYDELQAKMTEIKVENGFLQKKLSIFFKRRKMDYVLKESHQQFDTQLRYNRTLDTLKELIDTDQEQRLVIQTELNELKERKYTKSKELDKLFKEMQAREKEIGQGLINTKTGNAIQDKLIERLIRRQKTQMEEVCQMRLKYIMLRDMVTEKQDAIAALDNIGEGLHLMDYEQLKVDNRSHADKIEEKEEELTRLRAKCENTIQILAHLRDKSAALDNDMEDQKEDLNIIESQVKKTREDVNYLKQERDKLRTLRNELRQDSGLLAEPKLLRDMQDSIEELEHESIELDRLKEDVARKATQIRNIRRNIEHFTEVMVKKSVRMGDITPVRSKHRVFKGRPSLPTPILPDNAFNYMKNFNPKPRVKTKTGIVKQKMQ